MVGDMIPYEELVTALTHWRVRHGLPAGAPEYARALPGPTGPGDTRDGMEPLLADDAHILDVGTSEDMLESVDERTAIGAGQASPMKRPPAIPPGYGTAGRHVTGDDDFATDDVELSPLDSEPHFVPEAPAPLPHAPAVGRGMRGGALGAMDDESTHYTGASSEVGETGDHSPHPMEPVYDGGQGYGLPQEPYEDPNYSDAGYGQQYDQEGAALYGEQNDPYAQPDQGYYQPPLSDAAEAPDYDPDDPFGERKPK
jgi:hypothetical protein